MHIPTSNSSNSPHRPDRRRGFTLVEVLISTTLSAFILAGILSTFLFMGRSGANLSNYSDMESQARKALEMFAEDTRQASSINWNSGNSVTLTVNSSPVVYQYDSGNFVRRVPGSSTILVTGIQAPVARISDTDTVCTPFFRGYTVSGTELLAVQYASPSAAALSGASTNTKQLQISFEAIRRTRTVAAASNLVLSARFILRNKIVTA